MSKTNTNKASDAFVGLPEALRLIGEKYPWAPLAALRAAVREGRIESKRSSDKKRARHYVRVSDLEKELA